MYRRRRLFKSSPPPATLLASSDAPGTDSCYLQVQPLWDTTQVLYVTLSPTPPTNSSRTTTTTTTAASTRSLNDITTRELKQCIETHSQKVFGALCAVGNQTIFLVHSKEKRRMLEDKQSLGAQGVEWNDTLHVQSGIEMILDCSLSSGGNHHQEPIGQGHTRTIKYSGTCVLPYPSNDDDNNHDKKNPPPADSLCSVDLTFTVTIPTRVLLEQPYIHVDIGDITCETQKDSTIDGTVFLQKIMMDVTINADISQTHGTEWDCLGTECIHGHESFFLTSAGTTRTAQSSPSLRSSRSEFRVLQDTSWTNQELPMTPNRLDLTRALYHRGRLDRTTLFRYIECSNYGKEKPLLLPTPKAKCPHLLADQVLLLLGPVASMTFTPNPYSKAILESDDTIPAWVPFSEQSYSVSVAMELVAFFPPTKRRSLGTAFAPAGHSHWRRTIWKIVASPEMTTCDTTPTHASASNDTSTTSTWMEEEKTEIT